MIWFSSFHIIMTSICMEYSPKSSTFQHESWVSFSICFLWILRFLLSYVFIVFDVVHHDTFATLKSFQVKVHFPIKKKFLKCFWNYNNMFDWVICSKWFKKINCVFCPIWKKLCFIWFRCLLKEIHIAHYHLQVACVDVTWCWI
jgi:hypothetical protein